MKNVFLPYKVLVYFYDCGKCTVLEGFGEKEDSYIWADTAKRLIKEHCGFVPDFVISKDMLTISLDDVPDRIKSSWNCNIKSIPCYVYEFHTDN